MDYIACGVDISDLEVGQFGTAQTGGVQSHEQGPLERRGCGFNELRHFFTEYKTLENKMVKVEEFQGKDIAYQVLKDAIALYKDTYIRK